MKNMFIAVSGTMGVGKSTVARILAKNLDLQLLEENFEENSFLPCFYKQMNRWAFHSQTFFLIEKINQTKQVKSLLKRGNVIQDTSINQDVLSYGKAQFINGNMDDAEFKLYTKIYSLYKPFLIKPDLHIYLKASTNNLMERINKRDREAENNIPREYIELLDKLNKDWIRKINGKKKMYIETDNNNYVKDKAKINNLLETVKKRIKSIRQNEI